MTGGDFGYGNVRLRARATELLSAAELRQLATLDAPNLAAALAATPYRPALGGGSGSGSLLAAVGTTTAERRATARRFYHGRAGDIVDLLLARHDRNALINLLRAARDSPAQAPDVVSPSGRIPEPLLRTAAATPDLPAVVDLLARRGAPDPDTAAAVRRALRDYQLHDDWAAFETAAAHAHAAAVRARAAKIRPGQSVREVLAADVDLANVVAVVRAYPEQHGSAGMALLPGGRLDTGMLLRLAGNPAALAAGAGLRRPEWSAALTGWAAHVDPVRLQEEIEDSNRSGLLRRWRSGDPLGPDVPAGYLAAVEAEARNLALIIAAAGGRLDPLQVSRRLAA